jgi:hypothetical protein
MGIRIDAYAVDLPRFDTFLNSTLADLLCQYQRDGINEKTPLRFTIGNTSDTFEAIPSGLMRAFIGDVPNRKEEILSEEQLRKIEILKRPVREHLSSDNIYQAKWFLNAFSNCKGIDFIEQLTEGHRRWWIGSVLKSAQPVLSANEFKELEYLFAKILRGLDCGFNRAVGDPGFVGDGLPFTPDDDPDLKFGRWLPKECPIAGELLSKVMASSPKFRASEPTGIDQDDSDWHERVRNNVTSFLQIRDLDYSVCNMLSFIG